MDKYPLLLIKRLRLFSKIKVRKTKPVLKAEIKEGKDKLNPIIPDYSEDKLKK